MCLIIASETGIEAPPELLKTAFRRNPHGWGAVWSDAGKLHVEKYLTSFPLERVMARCVGHPYIVHFRLATHGRINIGNCHPFEVRKDLWMAHNGIIRMWDADVERIGGVKKRQSDSWHFTQLLSFYDRKFPGWVDSEDFLPWIEHYVGTWNKLAFLTGAGTIRIANKREGTEWKGLWLSNSMSIPDERPLVPLETDDKSNVLVLPTNRRDGSFKYERGTYQVRCSICEDWVGVTTSHRFTEGDKTVGPLCKDCYGILQGSKNILVS